MKSLTLPRAWRAVLAAPLALGLLSGGGLAGDVHAATPAELLAAYTAQAKAAADPERGQRFFNTVQPGELQLSCASCHGAVPTRLGKNVLTEKRIKPLAPAFNAERFTDRSRVEGWFRNNCKDVLGRECTAAEKADVLSWLLTLQP